MPSSCSRWERSPYRDLAHASAPANDNDPLLAQGRRARRRRRSPAAPFPIDVLYELALSPAVRLAAATTELDDAQLDDIADACWRAIIRPE